MHPTLESVKFAPPAEAPALEERRRNPRLPVNLKATRSSDAGFFIEDQVVNVSRSGFCLRTQESIALGSRLDILVDLGEGGPELTIQADVLRTSDQVYEQPDGTTIPYIEAGLFLGFVEPAEKQSFQGWLEEQFRRVNLTMATLTPRIRLELGAPDDFQHLQHWRDFPDRGLFIEIAYPLSIFDRPCIRLINPLTLEVHDLSGEVVYAQILSRSLAHGSGPTDPSHRYCGVRVRFGELSPTDQRAIEQLVAGLAPRTQSG